MNVLITGDDGPDAYGLLILREAARLAWNEARIFTVVPEALQTGQSMSITPGLDTAALELNVPGEIPTEGDRKTDRKLEGEVLTLPVKPADLIYLVLGEMRPQFLGSTQNWDLVLSGVNHGHNVGLDLLHSGSVGQALIATNAFGVTAWAFAQEMETVTPIDHKTDAPKFQTAERVLTNLLKNIWPTPGECTVVNFPAGPPKSTVHTTTAPYSRWRETIPKIQTPTPLRNDIELLKQGYVTIVPVQLSMNPPIRF